MNYREARIILPVYDNQGRAFTMRPAHAELQMLLSEHFGGFTKVRGFGGWKDGKRVQTEPV